MAYKVTNRKKFARFILIIVLLIAVIFGISFIKYQKRKAAEEAAAEAARQAEIEAQLAEQQAKEQEPVRPATTTPMSAYPLTTADDDWLVLVNKTHHVSESYAPGDLVTVLHHDPDVGNAETRQMRKVAADALEELVAGAEKDGYQIVMRTGYRSYSYQASLFQQYVKKNGEEEANKFSAKAGESEHQTGLCCDVGIPGVYLTGFTGTPEAQWIVDNAYKYGFILRFPENKTEVTGYTYESWHIRYVGKEAAELMQTEGLTLEEYLGILD